MSVRRTLRLVEACRIVGGPSASKSPSPPWASGISASGDAAEQDHGGGNRAAARGRRRTASPPTHEIGITEARWQGASGPCRGGRAEKNRYRRKIDGRPRAWSHRGRHRPRHAATAGWDTWRSAHGRRGSGPAPGAARLCGGGVRIHRGSTAATAMGGQPPPAEPASAIQGRRMAPVSAHALRGRRLSSGPGQCVGSPSSGTRP